MNSADTGPPPSVRQSLVYNFSPRGMEVTAELLLDASRQPLRRVALALDDPLQLVWAQCGEQSLRWSVASAAAGGPARVIVELPPSESATSRTLRLGAMTPLVTDRPWRLPRIQAEGLSWQEGRATLLAPSPLRIDQLVGIHCRQSKVGPLSSPRVGESIELQYFASDATAQVVLHRPETPPQVDWGIALELGGDGVAGRIIAAMQSSDREHFEIEANVTPKWIVDSVDSTPTGAVARLEHPRPSRRRARAGDPFGESPFAVARAGLSLDRGAPIGFAAGGRLSRWTT